MIQPTRRNLARANVLQENNYELQIRLGATDNKAILYYDSSVIASDKRSSWDGEGLIYWMGDFYRQSCKTATNQSESFKEWRQHWTASDTMTPIASINQWLKEIEFGIGYYPKQLVIPAETSDKLSQLKENSFAVQLTDHEFNWRSVCDIDIDLLFGGDEFLDAFEKADITLYFNPDDCVLQGILITSSGDMRYLEVGITISVTDQIPDTEIDDTKIVDGILSEEWNLESNISDPQQ